MRSFLGVQLYQRARWLLHESTHSTKYDSGCCVLLANYPWDHLCLPKIQALDTMSLQRLGLGTIHPQHRLHQQRKAAANRHMTSQLMYNALTEASTSSHHYPPCFFFFFSTMAKIWPDWDSGCIFSHSLLLGFSMKKKHTPLRQFIHH